MCIRDSYKHPELEGKRCVVSVDLSVSDDFSAVTYLFHLGDRYRNQKYCPFHSITEYFIPRQTIEKHPNRELYKKWEEQGHINVLETPTIDYDYLSNRILEKPYVIKGLGYDLSLIHISEPTRLL